MANDNRIELRQVIAEIASIDPVVAIDVAAMADCLLRVGAADDRARAAAAATVAAQPSKIALIGIYGPLTLRGSW